MKRLLKNKKALSPVVAAIILIAVTVAVSIAVAAWMGSLTIGFMETAEITITDVTFTYGGSPIAPVSIDLALTNTGTSAATITTAKINGETIAMNPTSTTLEAGTSTTSDVVIPFTTFAAGSKYSISVFQNDGTLLASYTATATGP